MADQFLIIDGEGFREDVYRCSQGYLTIGYGHRLTGNEKGYLKTVTKEQAEQMLKKDLQVARNYAESWFGKEALAKIGPIRAAVLVDMAYNLGSLKSWPKLTKAVKEGKVETASEEIKNSKYAKQVGDRAIRNQKIMKSGILMNKQQAKKQENRYESAQKKEIEPKTESPRFQTSKMFQRHQTYQKEIVNESVQYEENQEYNIEGSLDQLQPDDFTEIVNKRQISRKIIKEEQIGFTIYTTWLITYEIEKIRKVNSKGMRKLENFSTQALKREIMKALKEKMGLSKQK